MNNDYYFLAICLSDKVKSVLDDVNNAIFHAVDHSLQLVAEYFEKHIGIFKVRHLWYSLSGNTSWACCSLSANNIIIPP